MSQVSIFSSVKAKLDSLKGTGKPLVDVFAEHKTDFPGYPVATVEPEKSHNEFGSTAENMRTKTFSIVLHQEMESLGRANAIGVLSALVDSVEQAFESDTYLGGAVQYCQPVDIQWGEYSEGAGKVVYVEITLQCVEFVYS